MKSLFYKTTCLKYSVFVIIIKKYRMRKVYLALIGLFLCAGVAGAVERGQNTVSRQTSARNEIVSQTRSSQNKTVSARTGAKQSTNARRATNKTVVNRSAAQRKATKRTNQPTRISRAATTVATKTFGTNYNSCRDVYFTCMDQFCATLNENYRRCICSSKLDSVKAQEKKLSQTADSLKDFEDINIDAISKTAAEVKAMAAATAGESSIRKDKSDSAKTLSGISAVLKNSKQQALSTAGTLDIAGDIRAIWNTTDLIGGTNIANLSGEPLFNAVHTQCYDLSREVCSESDLQMVSTAYGMYIENDCSILQNNLDKQMVAANASIRSTRHKMQDARLENYDAHNSLTVNDCIANVRKSITNDSVCGEDYIHCLDFSGKYLNNTTGEAIYSPDFYQIENQLSLSGDILKNSKNAAFVNMLNKKRDFAQQDLDLCRDDSDYVWEEFLRQAIVEIYQGQQQRVATVKNECLQVVNQCYLKQSKSLTNFTDDSSQMVFVKALELSEEMCADKLNTCSNLYGGGPDGLNTLLATMTGITDLTIEQSCPDLLAIYAKSICAVPGSDSLHSYPFGCRKYAPGESYHANNALCNTTLVNLFSRSDIITTQTIPQTYVDYLGMCKDYRKKYTSCKEGFYLFAQLSNQDCNYTNQYCFNSNAATECRVCPAQCICSGGTKPPLDIDSNLYETCGQYYVGSLYQQLVIYALQNCTRTSDTSNILSKNLLAAVDSVAQSIRESLIPMLAKDCNDMNGIWVYSPWVDENNNGYHDVSGDALFKEFYVATGTNKLWGYCKDPNQ